MALDIEKPQTEEAIALSKLGIDIQDLKKTNFPLVIIKKMR